ncbi:beta-N-acetylglucosaminidase domain-containing protein [Streptomyces sp. ODS05-4]|uniref:beta-N-acetylglucosaminidase domain-containing protein n=1 Tax=Streptomyces sp. ODS05-4 TaxID=2944939 RepID=UPI00210C4DE1|nr:beta-N-acetylglucosaminidase domain-containing protein [Streptomyces sp. ODS05-4]
MAGRAADARVADRVAGSGRRGLWPPAPRTRTATAVALAVLGGLLTTAPGPVPAPRAAAAPLTPDVSGPAPARTASTAPGAADPVGDPSSQITPAPPATAGAVPAVWPRPQSLVAKPGTAVALGGSVTLVVGRDEDPYAVAALEEVLRAAGVRRVERVAEGPAGPAPGGRGPVVLLGGAAAWSALRDLGVPERGDLPAGGYRLATGTVAGRATVAVDGASPDGLFHAVQTLRQLVAGGGAGSKAGAASGSASGSGSESASGSGSRAGTGSRAESGSGAGGPSVPGVVVRDWPGTAVRGVAEGFYGRPWSQADRLAQMDFMGRTKQNRYLYAPGDDPYRQTRWREPYPAAQRAAFRELAERARRNHVTLAWSLAPAQSMCLSSEEDLRALKRKAEAMYALGVRAFQLQFQDAGYDEWHCARDAEVYGSGPAAAARAHALVAGELSRHLTGRHSDAAPLTLVPTEFYQDGATDYRTALAAALDGAVQVAWTGVGAVPRTITGRELSVVREVYGHKLVTLDNYPVNDYAADRLFLGPVTGREPAVAAGSAELLANAMEQPAASRIPLFTAADFAWNPKGYQPGASWGAALDDLAGGDAAARGALHALAGNGASSILAPAAESAYLRPLLAEFWRSRADTAASPAARKAAADRLRAAFAVMRTAPERLASAADGKLAAETRPWLERLARYGRAGEAALDVLRAQAAGDGAAARRSALALEGLRAEPEGRRATVGAEVLDPFLDRAEAESAAWTGGAKTDTSGTVPVDPGRPLTAVTATSDPGTGAGAAVEAYDPGQGWRRLGALHPSGWTQLAVPGGLRAERLRTAAPDGVHTLTPWYADGPPARLELPRPEADAVIGAGPHRFEAVLRPQRPAEVRGSLTARAPKGLKARVPRTTAVPRGTAATVPVEVTVPPGTPAGSYPVELSFAGQRRTLTVRAFPATGGPDLARTATASSSGDETPDFPARAAADGDAETRWSSPVAPTAWWQLRLPRPARVGQLVLHWQDAYAKRYRVQVSADGRTWRTAAAVRDGRGGTESVRLDAPGTRFVRLALDERGTEFGYSLVGVEAYAVR